MSQLLRGDQVTAGTARAVAEAYSQLWDKAPAERDHREKIAAARARNHARERGWAVPMAWDDAEIDKPEGKPAEGWRREPRRNHRSGELAEDAAELFRQGYTREQAAERLGVSPDALEQALRRAQRAAEEEHEGQRARFAAASAAKAPAQETEREAG